VEHDGHAVAAVDVEAGPDGVARAGRVLGEHERRVYPWPTAAAGGKKCQSVCIRDKMSGHRRLTRPGLPLPGRRFGAGLGKLSGGTREEARGGAMVDFVDKLLNCRDCGKEFVFTVGEQ